jgi:hypothetical protein
MGSTSCTISPFPKLARAKIDVQTLCLMLARAKIATATIPKPKKLYFFALHAYF